MACFVGRDQEIDLLKRTYRTVREGRTKMVAFLADTGIGKTRLLQEFYHWLSTEEDPEQYWPDMLDDTRHTMTIVPAFSHLESQKIRSLPWMWLALRCQNQDERNSDARTASALSMARQQVRLHLGALMEARRQRTANVAVLKSVLTILANYAFPGGGPAIISVLGELFQAADQAVSTWDAARSLWEKWTRRQEDTEDRVTSLAREQYASVVDQTLEVLSVMFNRSGSHIPPVPVILVVDDAQWADPLTLEFLEQALLRGRAENWPLMVVVTCWEASYKEARLRIRDAGGEGERTFAALVERLGQSAPDLTDQVLVLNRLPEQTIELIAERELPHVGHEALELLVKNCSGDLELLMDYIRSIRTPVLLDKDGRLRVPPSRLPLHYSRKKELVRERIRNLGVGISCLVAWGSAQGIRFSQTFIDRCIETFGDAFGLSGDEFIRADTPYNLTHVETHAALGNVAEFRRSLYFQVAREMLDDLPNRAEVAHLLLLFYSELIVSDRWFHLEREEQRHILEEFRSLAVQLGRQEDMADTMETASIRLMEIYLQDGLFTECLALGEELRRAGSKQQRFVLGILIESALGLGDDELEERYINAFCDLDSQDPLALYYWSRYAHRHDAEEAVAIAALAKEALKDSDPGLRYKVLIQEVVANFYAGRNQEGFRLLGDVESEFGAYLQANFRERVSLDHAIGLLMHNVDLNEQLIARASSAKSGFRQLGDTYHYLLSLVNLSDALLAAGRWQEAEKEGREACDLARALPWVHARNIAFLNYGNVLSVLGQYREALEYYREGLALSAQIKHLWDYLYGRIWASLAQAERGEESARVALVDLCDECDRHGYSYLTALSACFALVANSVVCQTHLSADSARALLDRVTPATPGLRAQAIAAYLETYRVEEHVRRELLVDMAQLALSCEGIKGRPEVLRRIANRADSRAVLPSETTTALERWLNQYVPPRPTNVHAEGRRPIGDPVKSM